MSVICAEKKALKWQWELSVHPTPTPQGKKQLWKDLFSIRARMEVRAGPTMSPTKHHYLPPPLSMYLPLLLLFPLPGSEKEEVGVEKKGEGQDGIVVVGFDIDFFHFQFQLPQCCTFPLVGHPFSPAFLGRWVIMSHYYDFLQVSKQCMLCSPPPCLSEAH